jgi:prevent-host-death family protein
MADSIQLDAKMMGEDPNVLNLKNDIQSLTDFKRNTAELIEKMKRTGHPLVLTVNGKAELVVQDAETYQEIADRLEAIEGVRRGLDDLKAGRTRLASDVHSNLRERYAIPD